MSKSSHSNLLKKQIQKLLKQRDPKQWFIGIIVIVAIILYQFLGGDSTVYQGQVKSFDQAKRALVSLYKAHPDQEEFYCGCDFDFNGNSGIVDLASCGYKIRTNPERANRIEWEHVVPAHAFGKNLQCWKEGGRSNCKVANDQNANFNMMEGDMHNLQPSVGEVNADRANFSFAEMKPEFTQYGACAFKTDFKKRQVMPREEVRGVIARTYLYMNDRYNVPLSKRESGLMQKWNSAYPATVWECQRNEMIKEIQGNDNPFITENCNQDTHWNNKTNQSAIKNALQMVIDLFK